MIDMSSFDPSDWVMAVNERRLWNMVLIAMHLVLIVVMAFNARLLRKLCEKRSN